MKVGAKVRIIGGSYGSPELRAGETGVVFERRSFENCDYVVYLILMDNGFRSILMPNGTWAFTPDQIEAI